jgi:GT2 family glycosyltransferase
MVTKVSVVTPVWNQWAHTARYLLQSWQCYRERREVEFIIINNGSSDNTGKLLSDYRDKMNNLRVITNEENQGFPIACNQGARKATGEVLLFLNNDVLQHGDYVGELLRVMDDNLLAGPELNQHNTGWNVFGDLTIPYIAGWCLALTKATYEKLGGFDERYSPCDYEDMDLCYAGVKAGVGLLRLNLPIRHISGGSAMPDRLAITERNRAKFAEKWGLTEGVKV